jgi:hypothetical protein
MNIPNIDINNTPELILDQPSAGYNMDCKNITEIYNSLIKSIKLHSRELQLARQPVIGQPVTGQPVTGQPVIVQPPTESVIGQQHNESDENFSNNGTSLDTDLSSLSEDNKNGGGLKDKISNLFKSSIPNPYSYIIKNIKSLKNELKSVTGTAISPEQYKLIFESLNIKEHQFNKQNKINQPIQQQGQQYSVQQLNYGMHKNDRELLQEILNKYNNIVGNYADIKSSIQNIPDEVEQLVLKKLTMNELERRQLENRIKKQLQEQDEQNKSSSFKELQQEKKNLEMILQKYRQYGYIGLNPHDNDDIIKFVNPDVSGNVVPSVGTVKSFIMNMYKFKNTNKIKYNYYRSKFIQNQITANPNVLKLPNKLGVNDKPFQHLPNQMLILASINNLLQKEAFIQKNSNINDNNTISQVGGVDEAQQSPSQQSSIEQQTSEQIKKDNAINIIKKNIKRIREKNLLTSKINSQEINNNYNDIYFILPQAGPIENASLPINIDNIFNILDLIDLNYNSETLKYLSIILEFLLGLYGFIYIELFSNNNIIESNKEKVKQIESKEPKQIESKEPKQIESEEPKQIESEEPKQIESEEPKQIKSEEPKQIESEESKQIESEEPKQIESEEPKQIESEESNKEQQISDKKVNNICRLNDNNKQIADFLNTCLDMTEEERKKELKKFQLISHPDKNSNCREDANNAFLQLNEKCGNKNQNGGGINDNLINKIFFDEPNKVVPNTLTPGFIIMYEENGISKYITLTNDCYQSKGISTNAGQVLSNNNNLKFRLIPSHPDDVTLSWTNSYVDFKNIELDNFKTKESFIQYIKNNSKFDISEQLIINVILIYNPKLNTNIDFINIYKNNKLFSDMINNKKLSNISGGKKSNKKFKNKTKKINTEIIDIKKFFSPKIKYNSKNKNFKKSKKLKNKAISQKKGGSNMKIIKPQVTITDTMQSLLMNKNLQGNKWLLNIPEINKLLSKEKLNN